VTSDASALYEGAVVHQRLHPRRHRLRYRLFQLLIDLDEIPALDRRLVLFRHNRPAPLSLYDRDHCAGEDRPLRPQVEAILEGAEVAPPGGPIRLLAMPRVLGYVFNPLSIFYCHAPSGELRAVVLQVNNTFGERHFYVVRASAGRVHRGCQKAFFVSPFLPVEMRYAFRLNAPDEHVTVAIVADGPDGRPWLSAALHADRRPLTDRTLVGALLRHPLATAKVIAAIHLEAAKLLAKGVRLVRKPPPPAASTTVADGHVDDVVIGPLGYDDVGKLACARDVLVQVRQIDRAPDLACERAGSRLVHRAEAPVE